MRNEFVWGIVFAGMFFLVAGCIIEFSNIIRRYIMWVNISKWLFKLYIIWSVCADIVLIAGIVALLFGDIKVSF
jgi:hypothetical protein